ncbi:RHS repeat-associated core domain-containing protein [Cupriavidus pauculus]|uniref:RHS repeat-associated core domain-containing protein n=1 Tax=Cupriavidus pauculus TaxID=82633 RepID=UPI001FD1E474|nr:RHS repeat-associated core domain-containing protein [Cupriavidus pauculus]
MLDSSSAPTARPDHVAVAPLHCIHVADVCATAVEFDTWLQRATRGYVSLARIKDVAGAMPVMGNIIALGDALGDIAALMERRTHPGVLDWAGIGINLLGVMPDAETAAVRMSLRPMLALARQEVVQQTRSTGAVQFGASVLATLQPSLNASIAGDIENYLAQMQELLPRMLAECGNFGAQQMLLLARAMEQIIAGPSHWAGQADADRPFLRTAGRTIVRDPRQPIGNFLQAAFDACRLQGPGANGVERPAVSPGTRDEAMLAPAALRAFAPRLRGGLALQSDPAVRFSIAWLVGLMREALAGWRRSGADSIVAVNVRAGLRRKVQRVLPQQQLESIARNVPARGSPNPARNGPAPAATHAGISLATGDQSFSHTDFQLPGLSAMAWTRTYRSSLAAYDDGTHGARWITDYTTRFDVLREQGAEVLRHHAADGRTHAYPLPAIGGNHRDPIEQVTLERTARDCLILVRRHGRRDRYQRHGNRFRLTSIDLRGGARVALVYGHREADGGLHAQAPSAVMAYQGDVLQAHIVTRIDQAGRIESVWEIAEGKPDRQLARYDYDQAGNLVRAEDEHGASRTYRYRNHLVTRYTDRTARGVCLLWDGDGPDAKAVHAWSDDGSFDTRLTWDDHIRLTCVTDALGNQTWHYYDILGYTYRIRHADGLSEWFFRDTARNTVQHVRPCGAIERYTYDARGNLLEHLRADHSAVHYAWDDKDQLVKMCDAEGGLWTYDYDLKGNVTEAIDPLGHATEYTYNKANLPVRITDANGVESTLAYNAAGQLTRRTDSAGKTSAWQYDDRGQLTAFTDAAGNVTRYTYSAGRLQRIDHPDQQPEHFEHDAEGRLLSHTDALNRRTTWRYNEAGLLDKRTDAANQTISYRWDRLGRLVTLTNENNASHVFGYDAVGRLVSETGFDGRTRRYFHAGDTGVLAEVAEGDWMMELEFDAMGRLIARHARRGDDTAIAASEAYAYDGNGRLILAENATSRVQWFHDACGNIVREHHHYRHLTQARVAVWRHEYDALNQRVATVRPDGHRIGMSTDEAGHIVAMHLDDQELARFERDDLYREVHRIQGNGLTQRLQYDAVGRLRTQTVAQREHPEAFLIRRTYRFDAVGQVTAIRDTRRGDLSYQYDPVARLLAANSALGRQTFVFDPAGNLLDDPTLRTFGFDAATGQPGFGSRLQGRPALTDNLVASYDGALYQWDARGNLVQRTINGQHEYFAWDGFNRLVSYANAKVVVRFGYDALGRRTWKHSQSHYFDDPRAGEGWRRAERARLDREHGCAMTLYGWDGDALAWESRESARDVDSAYRFVCGEARTTHYLYEPATFVPLAQAVVASAIRLHAEPEYGSDYDFASDPLWHTEIEPQPFDAIAWYHCDHLGTPQEISGPDGLTAWSAHYLAWGAAQQTTTSAAHKAGIQNPLRFQGQYFDHETGLHYNRYRYYEPTSGRFISRCPMGLTGGLNLHLYAPNPVDRIHPLGLGSSMRVSGGGCMPPAPAAGPACAPVGHIDHIDHFDHLGHLGTDRVTQRPRTRM